MSREKSVTARFSTCNALISKHDRDDMLLVEIPPGSVFYQVVTKNALKAAPVQIAEKHFAKNKTPRYLLFNSGCANAATGSKGLKDARMLIKKLATLVKVPEHEILPYSTGVIGERLPLTRMQEALPELVKNLGNATLCDAATAIMTTDTHPKYLLQKTKISNQPITIESFAKGAGMIHPNMATLLGAILFNASITPNQLKSIFTRAIENTFNRITVDGDTSTNDSFVAIAIPDNQTKYSSVKDRQLLEMLITLHLETLATDIVRDGEGATILIVVTVMGAKSVSQAKHVAEVVSLSPLVKTALHARDPNWGRIAAAVGRADQKITMDAVTIAINGVTCFAKGMQAASYTEAKGQQAMAEGDITVTIDLKMGKQQCTYKTCDLSRDYVSINADYRS